MGRRSALLCGIAVLLLGSVGRSTDVEIAVVVHPSRHVSLDVEDVARIFLKKQHFWDDGSTIVPLNREAGSALREAFSRRVLHLSSSALAQYWDQQYFLGTFPPATLASNEAMKRYIAAEPNAIGYIDPSTADPSVRVVLLLR